MTITNYNTVEYIDGELGWVDNTKKSGTVELG